MLFSERHILGVKISDRSHLWMYFCGTTYSQSRKKESIKSTIKLSTASVAQQTDDNGHNGTKAPITHPLLDGRKQVQSQPTPIAIVLWLQMKRRKNAKQEPWL